MITTASMPHGDDHDAPPFRCVVHPPRLDGPRVDFAWTLSGQNPFQTRETFHVTYPDLQTEFFARELWLEIFLALQLRVFARLGLPVVVELPAPLPEPVVAF
jgi:hypothetical protein